MDVVKQRGGLPSRVTRTLRERALIPRGARLLLACSGGPDSTAMLHVMARLAPRWRWHLEVVSLDHGLRREAHDEINLVAKHAENLGLRHHILRLELLKAASLQDAARQARYRALLKLMKRRACAFVAVGHTQNDQAETVIERLLRGSGATGLQGIYPQRPDGVVRPLIDATREQVERYLAFHKLASASDPSNRDARFLRTRIRYQLMPFLLSENPQIEFQLANLADEMRLLNGWLNDYLHGSLKTYMKGSLLVRQALRAAHPALQPRLLRALIESRLGKKALKRAQLMAAQKLLLAPGEVRLPGGHKITWYNKDYLKIV